MSEALENIPTEPFFVPKLKTVNSGVDFLNLGQVNFELMAECMPGTNNVTYYVRPYSLICWIYWTYREQLRKKEEENASLEDQHLFREKIESLHLWGHKLNNLRGTPGLGSKIPQAKDGKTSLRFKDWNRSSTNTSLSAGVQYGPSLGALTGLGFVRTVESGLYAITDIGEQLAKALDQRLKQSPYYESLLDLELLTGTEEMANDLFKYWRIDESTSEEAILFKEALRNSSSKEEDTNMGRRTRMTLLIEHTLRRYDRPATAEEIRRGIALPELIDSALEIEDGEKLGEHRMFWMFLQFRQLQRLVFESLMSWLENHLLTCDSNERAPEKAIEVALLEIEEEFEFSRSDELSSIFGGQKNIFDSRTAIAHASKIDQENSNPWVLIQELTAQCKGNSSPLPAALRGLIYLYGLKPYLEKHKSLTKWLSRGHSDRISLNHFYALVDRIKNQPLEHLIDWIFKNLIISQHFAVGTQRYDGERIRLRMYLDEDGLYPIINKRWEPFPTSDRLDAFLSLLEGCKLLSRTENDEYYLPTG